MAITAAAANKERWAKAAAAAAAVEERCAETGRGRIKGVGMEAPWAAAHAGSEALPSAARCNPGRPRLAPGRFLITELYARSARKIAEKIYGFRAQPGIPGRA